MKINLDQLACPFCCALGPVVRYDFETCDIVCCRSCGLMWLFPVPQPEQLHEIYNQDYYTNQHFLDGNNSYIYGYVDYIAERINKQYGYKRIIQTAKQFLPQGLFDSHREARWLDVGCGLGFLLDVAFDEGFEVHGIEFNPAAVDYIRSKYTFNVSNGTIHDLPVSTPFHVISMYDVIEHLPDPLNDLRRIRSMIDERGLLLVQTMDSDSITSRLMGKRLEDFRRIREHLFFFSRGSITRILDSCGWEVVRIESIGHTFQVKFLLDRIGMMSPLMKWLVTGLKTIVYPKYLLEAHIYLNPRTKMLVYAKPK